MGEEKKELIVRIRRAETRKGAKPAVEMWNDNPRLEFPELRLFDLHLLFDVGIDPNGLAEGEERITRFWAYYELSDRANKNGNPYKDVTRLVPIQRARSHAQETLDEMLAVLLRMERDVALIRAHLSLDLARPPFEDRFTVGHHGESAPATLPPAAPAKPAEEDEDLGAAALPLDEDQARRKFGHLTGPAVRDGLIPRELPSELAAEVRAGAINWRDALARVATTIDEAKADQQYESV